MSYRVAVVGATGAVGMEIIKVLESRNFPVAELRLFASERSAGKKLPYQTNEQTYWPILELSGLRLEDPASAGPGFL